MSENTASTQEPFPLIPVIVFMGAIGLLLLTLLPRPVARPVETQPTVVAVVPTSAPTIELNVVYDAAAVVEGETVYLTVCAACHGQAAHGVPGLGKDLISSEFVHGLSDEEFVAFIAAGRPAFDPLNTTGIEMPARGGNPFLTDAQLFAVVAYLRTLAQEEQGVAAPTEAVAAVATEQPTTSEAAGAEATVDTSQPIILATGSESTTFVAEPMLSDPAAIYSWSCSGCHGITGEGVAMFGPPLFDSTLLSESDRQGLYEFLLSSPHFDDPTAGFPHPARGGYPTLTDEQLNVLVDYLLTLEPTP